MQTTYTTRPELAVAGQVRDPAGAVIRSYTAETDLPKGTLLQRGTLDEAVTYPVALPADGVDTIMVTPGASAAIEQFIEGAALDGVEYGLGARIIPAMRPTFTPSNHADWDLTLCKFVGEDAEGNDCERPVVCPNGGNATVIADATMGRVVGFRIPAQSGAGGTFTLGTVNDDYPVLSRRDFPGIAIYDEAIPPTDHTIVTGVDAFVEIERKASVLVKGQIAVVVEDAVAEGDAVYVRMVEAGTDIRGQFTSTPAAGFAKLPKAHFASAADANAIAWLELE